ncbi:hypothetical protein [Flavobacterium cerinum]|uniref:DUF4369 domain-containing protein n=1 Tax=Flavobacterium cerinum TaxID=2502784 RepID=A0ABY5IS22_9FLAO|nr:hypothetical protein [Flavobacterium cerinum]UUC44583.1 hypothetical protein NOX80_13185 [Flavobacterium cerinum]
MKNALLSFLLVFTSFCFSQKSNVKVNSLETKLTAKCNTEISCSQKFGITEIPRDYTLTVIFDKENLKFTTRDNPILKGMNNYVVTKRTDKYVIGSNVEGNFAFFDIKKKQFYYIDYFMSRYITAGYGAETSEIKQNVLKIMDILNDSSSQKDAIQYLIKQAE